MGKTNFTIILFMTVSHASTDQTSPLQYRIFSCVIPNPIHKVNLSHHLSPLVPVSSSSSTTPVFRQLSSSIHITYLTHILACCL